MLEEVLRQGLSDWGLPCGEEVLGRFRAYYEALTEANKAFNLTAVNGEEQTVRLHFLDSAAPARYVPFAGKSVIDVGSGAGFPGLPLKLVCPETELCLLDSLGKRVGFLSDLCAALGLEDVRCVHGRAEEPGAEREQYDYAISRAVARLNILCELCLPYVRTGGAFLALKGPALAEELREAERGIALLGGETESVFDYRLPGSGEERHIALIRKVKSTPVRYPRRFAQVKKSPL